MSYGLAKATVAYNNWDKVLVTAKGSTVK